MAKRRTKSLTKRPNQSTTDPTTTNTFHRKAIKDCSRSAPYRFLNDDDIIHESVRDSAKMYVHMKAKDPSEAILSSLAIAVSNAAHDCLSRASWFPPEYLNYRNVNLRLGLKAASTASQLIEALERRRGNNSANVSVGKVNVETGGQAIVGNVQSTRVERPNEADSGPKGRRKK